MDGTVLRQAVIEELGALFMTALEGAQATWGTADLGGIEQGVQALSRAVCGRVVEQVWAARVAALPVEALCCGACGRPAQVVDAARERHLQGLGGDYVVQRPYGYCRPCGQGVAPVDAALGLGPGALSPGLLQAVCRGGVEDAFGHGAEVVGSTLGITVGDDTTRRSTEGVGEVAEAELQAAITRAQADQEVWPVAQRRECPAVLVVEVDGLQVHLRDGWHEMKVGRVAPLGPKLTFDRRTGRSFLKLGASEYCASLEEAEAFWWRVHVTACRYSLGSRPVTVVVLADGAEWIWNRARAFLALPDVRVVEILDLYHLEQRLWTVAKAVFGNLPPITAAWVEPLLRRLYGEGAPPVLAALRALQPSDEEGAEAVRTALDFVTTQAARMNYPAFAAQQFPLGSGAIESSCRALIAEREKKTGMRWSRAGAQTVATLRALHRSGQWAAFWHTQPQCRRRPICPVARARQVAPAAPPPAAPVLPPAQRAARRLRCALPATCLPLRRRGRHPWAYPACPPARLA
ncbi:MAG: hypothetical protein NVSMB65_19850 [Chloroflexota bacterium]